jgi:hypothetical protein
MIDTDIPFNPADFQSAKIDVTFENTTSRSAPISGVAVLEIDEKQLVLELPAKSCALNHNASIKLVRTDPNKPAEILTFKATAKVVETEKTDDPAVMRVRTQLMQYDDATWNQFLKAQGERQAAINKFIAGAQG